MSLPIVKLTKYDLLTKNIPATLATEKCLIVLEDTDEMIHWDPKRYIDMCTNARIERYAKLINQMNYNKDNVGYIVDLLGNVEGPYENTEYSDHTTTSSYKYGGAAVVPVVMVAVELLLLIC